MRFAVARALPGDRVVLRPGLYTESVVIRRGGIEGAPLTLQAGYRGEAWWGIGSRADVIGYPNAPLGGGYYRHRDGDYLLHGPFVRVTVGLGGP
jgi:hypothetical protein